MSRRTNWRGQKEWASLGLPFSTTSDEALKLFDAALTQVAGFYNDSALGGLAETFNKLVETDPDNVMAYVIILGISVGSDESTRDENFQKKLNTMSELAKRPHVSSWEKQHARAMELLANGRMIEACTVWNNILLDYPLDFLALKLAFDAYLFMGSMPERRDMFARAVRQWTPDIPLYGYVLGLYAFSLCETNIFNKAEAVAKKSLDINPFDAWSAHALTHTYEMQGRTLDSLNHLKSTVKEWSMGDILACHNYWHMTVDYTELGNYEQALEIYDSQVLQRSLVGRSSFNICDCSSLLFRLQMEGVSVGERWDDVYELCRPKLDGDHFTFYDPLIIMACLGVKKPECAKQMMSAIQQFIEECSETHGQMVKREVGTAICEALIAFDEENSQRAVELLLPVRYDVYRIGGSNAQRDVFNLFLIHAAMKSPLTEHKKLARTLLYERKELVEDSPLTDRLMAKALILH